MKVLVIPEDFRKDQFILKPVITALLGSLNVPNPKVRVCQDPLLGGIGQALREDRIREIVERYPMIDLFLLCVDRDGQPGRKIQLDRLESSMNRHLSPGKTLFAENAWQEIEVWILAGMNDLPAAWSWNAIRDEPDSKEIYFQRYAQDRGLGNEPGEGRKSLAESAAARIQRIVTLCPEDVGNLKSRIADWIHSHRTGP